MPVLQKKALFSAFIICQVLRIIQNYMEVSPAKSLILSATIHGGSYFFIQPSMKRILSGDQGKASPVLPVHVYLSGIVNKLHCSL